MDRKSNLILHPVFLSSVILLFVNDHFLKYTFHNWLTGKLSDFAGLIALPMFIVYCVPRISRFACLLTIILFVFWKSHYSESLILFLRDCTHLNVYRTVDYSDLLCIPILIIPYFIIKRNTQELLRFELMILKPVILFISFIIFTATSLVRFESPDGTVAIKKSYVLKVPDDTVLSRIKNYYNYDYYPTKVHLTKYDSLDGYEIRNLIIPSISKKYRYNGDTIQRLTFYIADEPYNTGKRRLYIHEATFSDTLQITDWQTLKYYNKIYCNAIEKLFAKEAVKRKMDK